MGMKKILGVTGVFCAVRFYSVGAGTQKGNNRRK